MALITACGIAVADIIATDLPKVARPGEVVYTPRPIELKIGGHPCNVSVDLVQMGLSGEEISVVIAVGKDAFGDFIEGVLTSIGVNVHIQRADVGTSKNLILIVRGEDRRFHVDVGANPFLDPGYVLSVLREDNPYLFYVGATGMLGRFDDALREVCEEAKALGSLVFTDMISPYGRDWDYIIPSFEWMDIFHCNAAEASGITGKTDVWEAAMTISDMGVKACIVTMGGEGLIAKIGEVGIAMPAFNVRTVDPTGAGDAFCAGLLLQLTREPYHSILRRSRDVLQLDAEQWLRVLMYGSACGAACCQAVGTTASVKPEYVEPLIKEQGKRVLEQARKRGDLARRVSKAASSVVQRLHGVPPLHPCGREAGHPKKASA